MNMARSYSKTSNRHYIFLFILTACILIGLPACEENKKTSKLKPNTTKQTENKKQKTVSDNSDSTTSVAKDAEAKKINQGEIYKVVIYDDDSGDFIGPDGGRICGVDFTHGRSSDMMVFFTDELKIFGIREKCLYFIDGYVYVRRADYSSYKHGDEETEDKRSPVKIEETDKKTVFSFPLKSNQVESFQTDKYDLSKVSKNKYVIVLFPDDEGALYAPGYKRLCGLNKAIYDTAEYELVFGKEIRLFGKKIKRITAHKGYLYFSALDVLHEDNNDTSKRVASVDMTTQGGVKIFTFSDDSGGEHDDSDSSTGRTSNMGSFRHPTSVDDLQNRIVGTVWTCMDPSSEFWYRLIFHNNTVTVDHSSPLLNEWRSYRECTYVIKNATTFNTGESCISVDLYPMEEGRTNYVIGSLMFFDNGEIEFSWNRGNSGGVAQYGDPGF